MRGAGHGFLTHPFIHLRPKAEKVCNPYTGIWFHRSTRTKLVDSTAGCEMLSFLDAYSGYQQVYMAEEDKEKTSLIAPSFCYKRMPFGLINAGATFKRLMSLILRSQLGRLLLRGQAIGQSKSLNARSAANVCFEGACDPVLIHRLCWFLSKSHVRRFLLIHI